MEGAFAVGWSSNLCSLLFSHQIFATEDWENEIVNILDGVEQVTSQPVLHTVLFY